MFTISTDDKKILTLNPAFEKYTKWKPEEWIGKSIYEVLRFEDFPKVQERFSEVLEGKTTLPFELIIITKDNRFIIGEFIATPEIKDGEVKGIIGFARDITSRKQMENRIKVTAEQLENLSRRLINTQENERQRIAKELHDQLGQDLTVLKFNIRNTLSKIKENEINIRTRLEELILFIDNVIENIRKLAHDLMPSMIEDLGLKAALIKLIENFVEIGNYDYKINIDDIDDFIPTKNQILIYRIFQEILTNIAKHAQASYIEVDGFLQDSKVNFTITDNGIGIEMDRSIYEKDSTKGIGLSTIEARARIMKGDFIIRKLEDNGTYIKVSVPIEGVY